MSLTPHDFERIRQIVSDQIERNTNLVLQELHRMSTAAVTADQQLAQSEADLKVGVTAILGIVSPLQQKVTALQQALATAQSPDPAVVSAANDIESLAQQLSAAATSATPSAPAAPTTSSSSPATPSAGSDATTTTQAS